MTSNSFYIIIIVLIKIALCSFSSSTEARLKINIDDLEDYNFIQMNCKSKSKNKVRSLVSTLNNPINLIQQSTSQSINNEENFNNIIVEETLDTYLGEISSNPFDSKFNSADLTIEETKDIPKEFFKFDPTPPQVITPSLQTTNTSNIEQISNSEILSLPTNYTINTKDDISKINNEIKPSILDSIDKNINSQNSISTFSSINDIKSTLDPSTTVSNNMNTSSGTSPSTPNLVISNNQNTNKSDMTNNPYNNKINNNDTKKLNEDYIKCIKYLLIFITLLY